MKLKLLKQGIQINEDDSYMATVSKEELVSGAENVGFTNCSVGMNIFNKDRRMGYGFNHYNNMQESLTMSYEQDGFRKIATSENTKELMPSNLRLRQNRHALRDEACTNKALVDNTARTTLLSGHGQVRGFEIPEKDLVKAIIKDERDIDTDNFGDKKTGFGQAGISEIDQLKEAVKEERKHDKELIKQEETQREKSEMQTPTIKSDINEIKNF